MREIKFRGKGAVTGKWVYGYYANRFGQEVIYHEAGYKLVIAGTVGQYTGLKDKNGKEIYEGDIVSEAVVGQVLWNGAAVVTETVVGKIFWNNYGWDVSQNNTGKARILRDTSLGNKDDIVDFHFTKHDGEFMGWDSIEVIGNIHEAT